jgi:hypothetical protein
MNSYLVAFDCKVIIGESEEQDREFFSAEVQPEFREAKLPRLAVGICSEGHGIAPQLLPLPDRGLLLLGLNSEVVAIRVATGEIAYRVPLGFLFRSMVPLTDCQPILVFHEIGVTAIRANGETEWTLGRDVLEDAWLEDGTLRMTFMDSEAVAVELSSGRELK